MKDYQKDFPLINIKVPGSSKKFDLSDPQERKKYFELKAGPEIKKIKEYLANNSFIAYWLGKKNSGKGTYSKLLIEIFGEDKIAHVSIGDVVRSVHQEMKDAKKKKELLDFLNKHYRGYISVEEALDRLMGRDTSSLLPTEFILALVKREIDRMDKKSLFIDGFPRELDQVSYSLFFRDLINYREDMDIFIAIDVPETVIAERMKSRVVCPKCHVPRSLKLLATKEVIYDDQDKEFKLVCDDPSCQGAVMEAKEGDDLGIEAIKDRLKLDGQLIDKVFSLHGIPKILIKSSVPVALADQHFDDYEITPEYHYELDENKKVKILEKPWQVKDEEGKEVYSLLSPAAVLLCLKQLAKILP